MAARGRSGPRRGGGRRGRADGRGGFGDEDDDDEEYVAEEEEEEEGGEDEWLSCESLVDSDEEEEEESDAEAEAEASGSDASFEVEEEEDEEGEEEEEEDEEEEATEIRPRKKGKRRGSAVRKRRAGQDAIRVPSNGRAYQRRSADEGSDYEEDEFDEEDDDFAPDQPMISKIGRKNGSNGRRDRKKSGKGQKRVKSRVCREPVRNGGCWKRKLRPQGSDREDDDEEDFVAENRLELVWRTSKKRSKKVQRKASTPARSASANLDAANPSDFDYVGSDIGFVNPQPPLPVDRMEAHRGKQRRKRLARSESSDSDYIASEEEEEEEEEDDEVGELEDEEDEPPLLLGPSKLVKRGSTPPPPPSQSLVVSIWRKGRDKGKGKEVGETAPTVCGICLTEEQKVAEQGVLDCCTHYFCFPCIMEWSKVETKCPMCKQRFVAITEVSSSRFGLGPIVHRVKKRDQVYQPTEEEMRGIIDPYENVVCIECQQGGDDSLMLLCDTCDSAAHTYCVGLGQEVPEGNWYCDCCRIVAEEAASGSQSQVRINEQAASDNVFSNRNSEANGSSTSSHIRRLSTTSTDQPSVPQIDLNLPPRLLPEEDNWVSPRGSRPRGELSDQEAQLPGAQAMISIRRTLNGRRAIHRRIRSMIFNNWPSQGSVRGQQDSAAVETEQGFQTPHPSMEAGPSIPTPDVRFLLNNLDWSRVRALQQFMNEGSRNLPHNVRAVELVESVVKTELGRLSHHPSVGENHLAFKNIEARATHTILAACGIEHNSSMVVAPLPRPSPCSHCMTGQSSAAFPAVSCCSSCFGTFVHNSLKQMLELNS